MADLIDTILKIPLFSGLSREDIAKILGRLEEISFRSGAVIFSQGDAGDPPSSLVARKIAEGTPLFLAYGGYAFLPVGVESLMVSANKIVASNTG